MENKALTREEFTEVCRWFHDAGLNDIPFDDALKVLEIESIKSAKLKTT